MNYLKLVRSLPALALLCYSLLFASAGSAQTTRVEDDHPSITYTGNWSTIAHPSVSGGTIKASQEVGATASIAFNGTGIAWIGYLCPCGGSSAVSIDGRPLESWDSYHQQSWPQQDFSQVEGLSDGPHVLTIQVRGRTFGSTGYTGIDAFDINPTYDAEPRVSITSPANGALVDGVVTVVADAYDHAGLEYVLFRATDITNAGSTRHIYDYTAPYSFTADASALPQGNRYRIEAEAWDHTDRRAYSNTVEVTVAHGGNTDFTDPFIEMSAPENNSVVTGMVTVSAEGYDDVGITRVDFYANGTLIGSDTTAPWSITRDTTGIPSGSSYTLNARAYDAAGNSATTLFSRRVTVQHEDPVKPTVSLTTPANGATVAGTVRLAAEASDNLGVRDVEFTLNPYTQLRLDPTAPYEALLDTLPLRDGPAVLTAKATDVTRNTSTTDPVTVNVDNRILPGLTRVDDADPAVVYTGNWQTYATLPTFSGVHRFHWASGHHSTQVGATAAFTFDGVRVRLLATACYSCGHPTISIDGGPPQTVRLTNDYLLSEGTSYVAWESPLLGAGTHTVQLTVQANDIGRSDVLIDGFEVLKVNDTAAPTVTLTSPVSGDSLSGAAVFEASASDDTGVAKVLFYAGSWLIGEDTAAPYSMTWDTRNYPYSSFDVKVVAYDLVGRRTESAGGRVTVNN